MAAFWCCYHNRSFEKRNQGVKKNETTKLSKKYGSNCNVYCVVCGTADGISHDSEYRIGDQPYAYSGTYLRIGMRMAVWSCLRTCRTASFIDYYRYATNGYFACNDGWTGCLWHLYWSYDITCQYRKDICGSLYKPSCSHASRQGYRWFVPRSHFCKRRVFNKGMGYKLLCNKPSGNYHSAYIHSYNSICFV